jgi:hypothetical protein
VGNLAMTLRPQIGTAGLPRRRFSSQCVLYPIQSGILPLQPKYEMTQGFIPKVL